MRGKVYVNMYHLRYTYCGASGAQYAYRNAAERKQV